jgi:hypothetical protein
VIRAPRPELGLRWESLADRSERLHFASETVGLLLVAVGSVVLSVVELGPWWFVIAVAVAAGVSVWVVAALKRRQLWLMRITTARDDPRADPPIASGADQRELARASARWSACLRQALGQTPPWPPGLRAGLADERLEPSEIHDLHTRDARIEAAHIPPAIAGDLDLVRRHGMDVAVIGDFVVVTAPDRRTVCVSRSAVGPSSNVAVLTRQRFLLDLERLGIALRPGPKGQPQVTVSDAPDHAT